MSVFNALIRTHHITSRKKVSKLRHAARNTNVFALLRSGGAPGIMYVEGDETGVKNWVEAVHNLRYKDYVLVVKPALLVRENDHKPSKSERGMLYELETVKSFAEDMKSRGLFAWWRKGMGYEQDTL